MTNENLYTINATWGNTIHTLSASNSVNLNLAEQIRNTYEGLTVIEGLRIEDKVISIFIPEINTMIEYGTKERVQHLLETSSEFEAVQKKFNSTMLLVKLGQEKNLMKHLDELRVHHKLTNA